MPPAIVAPPPTPAEPVTETLHGVEVTDPYRWLEDQNSPRTRAWIDEQTAYTRAYLDAIPGREQIRERARALLALKQVISEPWNIGDRYFFLKNREDREQPAIVMREGLFGPETVLVDPELRATGPSTAVAIAAISEDGRFLAYSVRHRGTDHSAIEILNVEQNSVMADGLSEGFCSGIIFAPDGSGFYYSHRDLRDPHPNYKAVFWHRLGTNQSQDREVFFAGEEPNLFLGILQSAETDLLAYTVCRTGKPCRTSLYVGTMSSGKKAEILLDDIEGCFKPFFAQGQLFAYTDLGAPSFRIVLIDLADPYPAHWRDIVPEGDYPIQQFAVAGDQIVVTRVNGFSTRIEAFAPEGRNTRTIAACPYGTFNLVRQPHATQKLFFSYTSISEPSTTYCYDACEGEECVWENTSIPFDPSMIAIEEVNYTSRDGTLVPLFLAARRDLLDSGPLPTFLTGYGGFGSCVTPRFTALATFLIEKGLLLAVPALRGGSELGELWHLAARREKRQNSFDDCIGAAEWLLSNGRSARGRIAIGGGSNAGLLVGAVITQRPDLFRAAICLGPILDMTRYHLFDQAAGWADEYGSPNDEQDFRSLFAYSPYHHVEEGKEYPAVLLISGDADTRCNPLHARKMTARLQAASRSERPVLLDYRPDWGHMPVQPLSVKMEGLTDRLAFLCYELGVDV
jgi:prolyl oligopeptidase